MSHIATPSARVIAGLPSLTASAAPSPAASVAGAFRKVIVKGKDPGRAADERTLAWVRLRSKGYAVRAIARAYGVKRQTVAEFTNNVLRDEIEYSGEGDVANSYWRKS